MAESSGRQVVRVQCSAGPVPAGQVSGTAPAEPVTLIPYGCARLRIAEFPHVTPAGL